MMTVKLRRDPATANPESSDSVVWSRKQQLFRRPSAWIGSWVWAMCALAVSGAGCQVYHPYGYHGYHGGYGGPMYRSGPVIQQPQVVPYSQPAAVYPGTVYPGNAYPSTVYPPSQVYPGQAIPGQIYPNQPIPNQTFPGQIYPDPAYPGGFPTGSLPSNQSVLTDPGQQGMFPSQSGSSANFPSTEQVPTIKPPTSSFDDGLGQSNQFPENNSSERPKMPREERLPVPNYKDADEMVVPPRKPSPPIPRQPAPSPTELGDPADFNEGQNEAAKKRATEQFKASESQERIGQPSAMLEEAEDDTNAIFAPPVKRGPAPRSRNRVQPVEHTVEQSELLQYGRSADKQSWFRGRVDYDELEKTWYLIYDPEPELEDELGGTILLTDHPLLPELSANDIVLVEGRFERNLQDQNGTPKYRVAHVRRLIP